MARTGSYFGGSTIIGPGRSWSGAADFGWMEVLPNGKRRRRRKIKQPKAAQAQAQPTLLVPLEKVHLIMSVMKDMGRPLPNTVKGLNKALRRLITDKVILADGEFNRRHPILRQWLARVESPKKVVKQDRPPAKRTTGTAQCPSYIPPHSVCRGI